MFLNRYNDCKKLQQEKKAAFINNCAPNYFQLTNEVTCKGNTESFRRRVQ